MTLNRGVTNLNRRLRSAWIANLLDAEHVSSIEFSLWLSMRTRGRRGKLLLKDVAKDWPKAPMGTNQS